MQGQRHGGRRRPPSQIQRADRETGVLPFMGEVPVSRRQGVRELWDNSSLPPEASSPAGDAPVQPAQVLPMDHQGRNRSSHEPTGTAVAAAPAAAVTGSANGSSAVAEASTREKQMDMPHHDVTPPTSPMQRSMDEEATQQQQQQQVSADDTLHLPTSGRLLDESLARAASGIFMTPDSSPAPALAGGGPATHPSTMGAAVGAGGWPAVLGAGRGKVEELPESPRVLSPALQAHPQPEAKPPKPAGAATAEQQQAELQVETEPEWLVNRRRAHANAAAARADGYQSTADSGGVSLSSLASTFRGGVRPGQDEAELQHAQPPVVTASTSSPISLPAVPHGPWSMPCALCPLCALLSARCVACSDWDGLLGLCVCVCVCVCMLRDS